MRRVVSRVLSAVISACVLAYAALTGAGCKKQSPANRYFNAAGDLHQASCACGVEARGPCNVRFQEFASCQLEVVRKHEDEIADFLDCATRHTVGQARCVERASCDPDRLDTCLESRLDALCGDLPERISDEIDDEIDTRCDTLGRDDDCANGECDDQGVSPPQTDPGVPAVGGAGGSPAGTAGGGGASVDPMLTCVDTTLAHGAELVTLGCAQCLCTISTMEITSCDAGCWALIRCAMDHCGFPDAETNVPCLQESCPSLLRGATSALTLADTARARCRNACPAIVP